MLSPTQASALAAALLSAADLGRAGQGMNGKEEIANRYRDAELDLAMYLGAVEHGDSRLAADILLSIGLTEPAASTSRSTSWPANC